MDKKVVDYYDRIADALEIISGDDSHIDDEDRNMDYYDRIADALENIAENPPTGENSIKSLNIDYTTNTISLKDKNNNIIPESDAMLPVYGLNYTSSTGGLTLTKNNESIQGQTISLPKYGSPLTASSTSEMTDTDKIYVNTTDGKWYYYDGTEWTEGGTYNSQGIDTDTTLLVSDAPADAKATGDTINALSNKTNLLHNLVNYGYENQELIGNPDASIVYQRIDVKRVNTEVTLNLPNAQTDALRIRVTSGIGRAATNNQVKGWENGITLINGHRYRASAILISGTVEGTNTPPVTLSIYKIGESSSFGTPDGTGIREFVFDGDPINIAIYVYPGTTLINAKYQVLLKDITESIVQHNEKPTLSRAQKQDVLDLITNYMNHATDTTYNTSVTWNYYASKNTTYKNSKLQVCCSSFAQLIWAGISPNTFFNDPANYNADIIKAFNWGYNIPFIVHQRAEGLAIREDNVITGYYGFHQGNTNKDSYSHTTYYNSGANENPNSQKFKTFMYAADIAAELCLAGYEIPIGEADVGDLLFFRSTPYANDPFSNSNFRQITHVAVVTGKTNGFYEIAESISSYDDRGIVQTSIFSENDQVTARAAGMIKNLTMAARHPAAYGIAGNVPNKFVTIPGRI